MQERARRVHYLSYDDFDPIEGLDRIESLLRTHLYVAVNLLQLCAALDKRYGPIHWYVPGQQQLQPVGGGGYGQPPPDSRAPLDWLDDRPWLHEPMLGGEVKIIADDELKPAANATATPKLDVEKPVQTKDKEQEKEAGRSLFLAIGLGNYGSRILTVLSMSSSKRP